MSSTILVTLLAYLASSTAAPYIYGSPFYAPYTAAYTSPAAYSAPALAATAYAAPAITTAAYSTPSYATAAYTAPAIASAVPGAALPGSAYPAAVPYPLSGVSAYTYGSSYSVQELAPLVNAPSAPLVLSSPYSYAAEYLYGR